MQHLAEVFRGPAGGHPLHLGHDPSEFAASLNSIGISYKVGYSVAIALRYIPDIQRDYHSISQAQQARGVELGKKEPFFKRLKNSVNILLPLILTSLNRIDTISNAMELRGFGKKSKRTWYTQRPFVRRDFIALGLGAALLLLSLTVTSASGGSITRSSDLFLGSVRNFPIKKNQQHPHCAGGGVVGF